MRRMSFAMTTAQIRNQTKTVTRRVGWTNLQPGTLVQPIVKGQGIKPGESQELIGAPIRIVSVRREPLAALTDGKYFGVFEQEYGRRDVVCEGFATMTPGQFVSMFCEHNKCTPDAVVTRIEFDYVISLCAAQMAFESIHAGHLRRRAGEDFEREAFSDDPVLEWLRCPSCGEMTLVNAVPRELAPDDAASAVSTAFRQHIERRFGARP